MLHIWQPAILEAGVTGKGGTDMNVRIIDRRHPSKSIVRIGLGLVAIAPLFAFAIIWLM